MRSKIERPKQIRAKKAKSAVEPPAAPAEVLLKIVVEHVGLASAPSAVGPSSAPAPTPSAVDPPAAAPAAPAPPPPPAAAAASEGAPPVESASPVLGVEPPRFHKSRSGYDPREVDAYVDEQQARLRAAQEELYELWHRERGSAPVSAAVEAPTPAEEAPAEALRERSRARRLLGSVLFYGILAALVFGVYLFGMNDPTGPPANVGGFSAMTVLTRSMQDVYPQDALIITRRVDPHTIGVGDDITFLMPNNTTITHRVVGIRQNYQNTGLPGFETMGTMNGSPDAEVVAAANVVGRVIFSSLFLGNTILFIRGNIWLICIFMVLGGALIFVLRKLIFGSELPEEVVPKRRVYA